jgi:hypothetical protein
VSQQSTSKVQDSIQPTNKLVVFDFYAGTGSSTQAFEDAGHRVIKVELDEYFEADERDILTLTAEGLIAKYGQPDFIWASPPCTAFSVASIGHHWNIDKSPKTELAKFNQGLVTHTLDLIKGLKPRFGWLMENPRGMLRILPIVQGLKRVTVTYCQYGDTRMKPTDLWGKLEWTPRPACKNGAPCHEPAPRGSRTGTQGIQGAKDRSRVPYELSQEICTSVENADKKVIQRGSYPHA